MSKTNNIKDEHKELLSKILGIYQGLSNGEASWAEIYVEIGKLQERAKGDEKRVKAIDSDGYIPHFQSPLSVEERNRNET